MSDRAAITVRLPTAVLSALNDAASGRRTAQQPVMSKARDSIIEDAIREFLAKPVKPAAPHMYQYPGRP